MNLWTTVRYQDQLFVFYKGELVYKRWYKPGTNEKKHCSILSGPLWHTVWIGEKS